jgi:serpin B
MKTFSTKSLRCSKYFASALVLSAFVFCFSCITNEDDNPSGKVEANLRALSLDEDRLSEANTQFATNLFQQLASSDDSKNLFFSPYSVHQALAMAMNGNDGQGLAEFTKVLQLEGMSLDDANQAIKDLTEFLLDVDPKVKLSLANGIWYKDDFQVQVPFRNATQNFFNAEIAPLNMRDPNSVNIINNWIEKKTNNLIKDMLDFIPEDAVMYLVNAIYFKGDWTYNFPTGNTRKEKFTLRNGQQINVDMMNMGESAGFKAYGASEYTYVEIPYSSG